MADLDDPKVRAKLLGEKIEEKSFCSYCGGEGNVKHLKDGKLERDVCDRCMIGVLDEALKGKKPKRGPGRPPKNAAKGKKNAKTTKEVKKVDGADGGDGLGEPTGVQGEEKEVIQTGKEEECLT